MVDKRTRRKSSKKKGKTATGATRSDIQQLWPNLLWPILRVVEQKETDGLVELKIEISFERDAPRKFLRDVLEEEFSLLLTRLLYQIEEDDLKILFHQLKKFGFQSPRQDVDRHSADEILTFLRAKGVPGTTLDKVRGILGPPSKTNKS